MHCKRNLFNFSTSLDEMIEDLTDLIVCKVFADKPEKRRASELFKTAFDSVKLVIILFFIPHFLCDLMLCNS